ncbi:RNA polymerase sigma factor [Erythrobacter sp. QSSC1-22B]|uniref:RNA polymerase sigma factor n=1 Tax=Erythrobacter sp. QSSC1-22B TaxID=1860125 RepID=UPI00143909F0|nr:sigma-70 family RNA polymerase sigma factor [Erythrobacter sp. QSSC1-22B]
MAALTGIADRDSEAMRRLYEATASELYAICFAVVRNREATEDVLQEVYTKVWNRAAGYDPEKGSPMVWLSFIARNSAIDRVRARGRRPTVNDYPLVLVADEAALTDERLIREEEAENLRREIDALSDPEQSYIRSAYLRGLTYSQVADEAGVPLGTVKTRIRRGLMALRAQVTRD